MKNENKLRNKELNHVNGGAYNQAVMGCVCHSCNEYVEFDGMESKKKSKGCCSVTVYKCGNCGKWIDFTG